MHQESVILRGRVLDDGSLELDSPVTLTPGPVEVVVRSLMSKPQGEDVMEVLARIRAEQAASGHVPRSAEEIDAYVRGLRDEWEERYAEIEAIQEECRRARTTPPAEPGGPS